VTEFLERLAGEPVDADIVSRQRGPAGDHALLGLTPDVAVMHRAVLLTGRTTTRRFVYAESAIVSERLPGPVCRRLETSRDPIGRVLSEYGLRLRREPLADPVVPRVVGEDIRPLLGTSVFWRRYRIIVDGHPVMLVSEWFLPPTTQALCAHLPLSVRPG
jgi:chorismate-pyruvate lyase